MRTIYIIMALLLVVAMFGCAETADAGTPSGDDEWNATGNETGPIGTGYAGRTNIRETTG